jgi:hypothetical protein
MKERKTRQAHRKTPSLAVVKPTIDFPKEGETFACPSYTLRLSAPGALAVHVALDQGPWLECRESVGYWWYDWTPEVSGEHEVIACALSVGGREAVSEIVHCLKT